MPADMDAFEIMFAQVPVCFISNDGQRPFLRRWLTVVYLG